MDGNMLRMSYRMLQEDAVITLLLQQQSPWRRHSSWWRCNIDLSQVYSWCSPAVFSWPFFVYLDWGSDLWVSYTMAYSNWNSWVSMLLLFSCCFGIALFGTGKEVWLDIFLHFVNIKVAHTRLPSIGFLSWSRFLAVSLQVTWIINPTVGCHYFPPDLQLPSQPLRGLLPVLLLGGQRHNGCEQFA